jgi:ELWxxDGT repeat protein
MRGATKDRLLMAVPFRSSCAPRRASAGHTASRWRRRLFLEPLEDRTLLSNAPVLVKDINPNHLNAFAGTWTSYQGLTFFAADDGIHGSQLWKTDGTAKGTVMVTDISQPTPNPFYGSGGGTPYALAVSQGLLFFTADDGVHGRTLWKTDGTASGTAMVADIHPVRGPFIGTDFRSLVPFNGSLYFFAPSATSTNLWKTDGTAAGTVEVTGKVGLSSYPADLTASGGALYFSGATNAGQTVGLWKSDGTAAGTTELAGFTSPPSDLTDISGTLYFAGDNQLWKSDGTAAGTVPLANASPAYLTNVNGTVLFASNGELWKSAGTAAGTVAVSSAVINPQSLTNVNGELFFTANDGTHGVELWKSDGTTAGTVMVKDIFPGPEGSYPADLTAAFGKLFFAANDGVHGVELWQSDGTAAGTALFKDLNPDNKGAAPGSYPTDLAFVNGKLFLQATPLPQNGEPWISDGTPDGTHHLVQINQRTLGSTNLNSNAVAIDSTYYFQASPGFGSGGIQLWKSDGTAEGTVRIVNSALLGRKQTIKYLTDVGGTLYFVSTDESGSSRDWSLWKSNGTAKGTVLVDDFGQFPYSRYYAPPLFNLTSAGHTLFFESTMGGFGQELWSSDGTAAGTHVLDINPAPYTGSYPFGMRGIDGTLYFTANDGTHGYELWKSDGTVAGTVLVKDINTTSPYGFPAGSYPSGFTKLNGSIYFSANDGIHGYELWKTDGTAAGTVLAVDVVPGFTHSYTFILAKSKHTLFLGATDGVNPVELWKTDGTQAGTSKVADIEPGAGDLGFGPAVALANGSIIFPVADAKQNTEIWTSNGTAAGTVLLAKFPNIVDEFVPLQLTAVGNIAYFVVDDGVHDAELWRTDGTVAGTFLTADLLPGPYGSNPKNLANADGTLFFEANDFIHGWEVFKVPPPEDGNSAWLQAAAPGAVGASGSVYGGTGMNDLLPAVLSPFPTIVGPTEASSKPARPLAVGSSLTGAFSAASAEAPPHTAGKAAAGGADVPVHTFRLRRARLAPVWKSGSCGADLLEPSAADALFASLG